MTLNDIQEAQERIAPYITKTPLLRLQSLDAYLGCQVYAKAECLQITGAFKLRGALNKICALSEEQLARGIVAASSGNHGKAVAYTAKMLHTKATIVMPYTAPAVKVNAIRALGAEVIQCETAQRFQVAQTVCEEQGAVMVPPFDDEKIMAGQGTAGLELIQQCPGLSTAIVPTSGGGLLSGVATAVKALSPRTKVYGAEPAALPRYSVSLRQHARTRVEQKSSVADALVAQIPGEKCFPCVQAYADGVVPVEDRYLLQGMKLLLMEGKLLCEPSSAIGIGAVLQGLIPVQPDEKVCFVISGGSVGFEQLHLLDDVALPDVIDR